MKRLALAMLLVAAPAMARVTLADSDPADGAHIKTPAVIRLHFTGGLAPADSGAQLVNAKGVAIPTSTSVGTAGISLLPPRLRPGAYKVTWHGKDGTGHAAKGAIAFTVVP